MFMPTAPEKQYTCIASALQARQKLEITPLILAIKLQFLHSVLPLMALYQCIKFHLIPLYTFRDTLRTSFLLQNLTRGPRGPESLT